MIGRKLTAMHAGTCIRRIALSFGTEREARMTKRLICEFAMALALLSAALIACASARAASSAPLLVMPPVGITAPPAPPATGTITTPTTPTVPPVPTPGRSTITIPGSSRSAAPSTRNPGTVRPCGGGANAAGNVRGNAGIYTAPVANSDRDTIGVPALGAPDAEGTTINPSVRPGVPGSC
jgi:hypothetical protein